MVAEISTEEQRSRHVFFFFRFPDGGGALCTDQILLVFIGNKTYRPVLDRPRTIGLTANAKTRKLI